MVAELRKFPSDISESDEKLSWLRLIRSENVGTSTFYDLLRFYGTATRALEAVPELAERGGRNRPIRLCTKAQAEKEMAEHEAFGAKIILRSEKAYPALLRGVMDAPPVLSVLGDADLLSSECIAIVGARNASLNGRKFAEKLAAALGEENWTISSGLARGIDTYAHRGSLETGTIAVIAGGIDHIYPPENKALYQRIREEGCVLSEAPFGAKPHATFFPKRNRIISGLSKGVVVVEAAQRSGSLITARFALEQNREIFAVPGSPFDPRNRGSNELIRNGAMLIETVEDVIDGLNAPYPHGMLREVEDNVVELSPPPAPISTEVSEKLQKKVLESLGGASVSLDELTRECDSSPGEMQTVILELELSGKILRVPGNKVTLAYEG
ncbi:MAG: DNA-processing protein DprA [Alphaproteobacteria bacterium]